MTRQEAFDRNWQHFVVDQKPKCFAPAVPGAENNCLYHDPKTQNCCGVGLLMSPDLRQAVQSHLLPIDELMSEMEPQFPAGSPLGQELEDLQESLGMDFLEALQSCHDNVVACPILIANQPVTLGPQHIQFARRLEDLAQKFNLVCPEVPEGGQETQMVQ